ncbi:MAG: hypothetical protein HGB02_05465 [Chlorobiaceae bacterium]|nr:hypothetical protein [Chlorobiaceae bacterium]
MKKMTILAVPLVAGSFLYAAGSSSAEPAPPTADRPGAVQQMQPKAPPPPPPPPQSEYPGWMPMHYQMPMHYRLLEPEMIYGYHLMSPGERVGYMQRLHSARSFEERDRLRLEHHRIMQDRARRRGVILPDMPPPGPRGRWQ